MRIISKKSSCSSSYRRTVALFGGSFNPPHRGHVAMVQALLRCRDIDQVWILPVFRHSWVKDLLSFAKRFHMCRLAFSHLSTRVTVKRIEAQLGGVSFTIRTLCYLVKQYPATRFVLVVGADSYASRDKWKDFDKIVKLVDLIVFERGAKSKIPNVSSTVIRKRAKFDSKELPKEVADYLRRYDPY